MPDEQLLPASAGPIQESMVGKIVNLEDRRRALKRRYDQLKAENESIKKELEGYKSRPTVDQLRAELLEIKHRKVFDQVAIEAKVNPDALDNLWKTSGYKIDQNSDVINEDAIRAMVAEQKRTQPYLFESPVENSQVETKPEPKPEHKMEPGPGNSRGGLVRDSGKFQVRRRGPGSIRDPQWMQMNQKAYAEAEKAGNVEWID